jgi:hypothetical protein
MANALVMIHKMNCRESPARPAVASRAGSFVTLSLLAGFVSLPTFSTAVTVGDPRQPGKLQQEIVDAYQSGAREITIKPGKYLLPSSPGPASLVFRGMKDVTIAADQVELAVVDPKDALGFYACENLVFRGAAIHYDHPRFCQARILGFGTDPTRGAYYEVQIDAGYPQNARFRSAYIFDSRPGKIKLRTGDMSARGVEAITETGKVRIFWGNSRVLPPTYNVQEGDYVVCRGDGNTLLHTDACKNCTFQNLSLYWGGVFGIFETGPSQGNHYLGINLTRGAVPPGATNAPFISQSADGLHSASARVGPDIENCLFESMCDDAFAIHGYLADVLAVSGNTLTLKSSSFEVGDLARISNTKGLIEEAKVQSVNKLLEGGYLVSLDHAVQAKAGDKVGNPSASGAGYRLLNNTIRNNRARGILAKGDDGLIEGNLIDGSTMSGISIGPEYGWNEGDYCRNIVIRNNIIRNTDYATNGQGKNGAVLIHGDGAKGNRNIRIENNQLGSILGPNLIVGWAEGVKVTGNTMDLTQRRPRGDERQDQAAVWLEHANDVAFADNRVTGGAPEMNAIVQVGEDVTAVNGVTTWRSQRVGP